LATDLIDPERNWRMEMWHQITEASPVEEVPPSLIFDYSEKAGVAPISTPEKGWCRAPGSCINLC
jgi:hypothetical protein